MSAHPDMRRYGFIKPHLVRLFTAVDAIGGLLAAPLIGATRCRPPQRILLVNFAHIGDVLMTTPAIAAIRAAHPGAHIAMLVGPWCESVVSHHPSLDEVLVQRPSWWDREQGSRYLAPRAFLQLVQALREGRFDAVVNFKSFFQENLACALAGIPQRIGYGLYGGGFLHTTCVPFRWSAHTVEQHLVLAAALGGRSDGHSVEIFPTEEDTRKVEDWLSGAARPLFALHLGAGAPSKRWPIERFAQLARILGERLDAHILLVGGRDDAPLAVRFLEHASAAPLDAVGMFTMPQLAVLLRHCRAFVGNDSGPAHVAAAVGIPTVTVFSGTNDVDVWRPWGRSVATLQERPECAPCGLSTCKRDDHACMTNIEAARVFAALEELLAPMGAER